MTSIGVDQRFPLVISDVLMRALDQRLVEPFHFPVRLWLIRRRKAELRPQGLAQRREEFQRELFQLKLGPLSVNTWHGTP